MSSTTDTTIVYCCKRCRCPLFTRDQLSKQHEEGKHNFEYFKAVKSKEAASQKMCSSYFLQEPNNWMKALTAADDVLGKLNCPKCSNRVGSFAWAGSQCSCGTWIVPALQFPISKVDPRECKVENLPELVLIDKQEENVNEQEENVIVNVEEEQKQQQQQHDVKKFAGEQHKTWVELTNQGDVQSILNMIDKEDCSITTIQKKCFEDFEQVSKNLSSSTPKLAGRIKILNVKKLPSPSIRTTRCLMEIENVKGIIGESIYWDEEFKKVQHITRIKNPPDNFLY